MPLPLLILGALLVFCAPARGADPPKDTPQPPADQLEQEEKEESPAAKLEKTLGKDLDPKVADSFLKDKALQEKLLAEDPALFERLFTAATESRELQDLLTLHDDPAALREALARRDDMRLANDPAALLKWASANVKGVDLAALEKALYGWKHLTAEQKTWLGSMRVSSADWDKMGFPERQVQLSRWTAGIYDQIMAMEASSPQDVSRMRSLKLKASETMTHDQAVRVSRRIEQADAAVGGLAQAEAKMIGVKDPKLNAALAKARAAPTMEARLASLGAVFDGLKINNPAVQAERPPTKEQRFSDKDKDLAARMLSPVLLREVRGTTGGDRVAEFYADKKNKMDISIGDTGTAYAHYLNGKIVFSERTVERYLKTYQVLAPADVKDKDGNVVTKKGAVLRTGVSVDELKTNPAVMKGLAWELSACFVHEGTHHMQDAWADQNKVPSWYVQRQETETMTLHGLFVLEKRAQDPAYAAFQDRRASVSERIRTDLGRARDLEDDPAGFRRDVRRLYGPVATEESAAYSAARTPTGSGAKAAAAFQAYTAYNERHDALDALVDERLKAVLNGEVVRPPSKSRVGGGLTVPAPSGGGYK